MNPQEAKNIVRNINNLYVKDVSTDADTVILKVKDRDRGPRNFHPNTLAKLLQHEAVFDTWVENDNLYIQLN